MADVAVHCQVLRKSLLVCVCLVGGWAYFAGADEVRQLAHLFFGTPHERYSARLRFGSTESAKAQAWLTAANQSVADAEVVRLPARRAVHLDRELLAAAYAVSLRRGQQYVVQATGDTGEPFIDLFRRTAEGLDPVASAEPKASAVAFEIRADGDYVVRVQRPLDTHLNVSLTFASKPTLTLPVRGAPPPRVQSFFGAARDGGRRSHHGVDIFAARGTPVIAASDGIVTSVGTNRLGGNVVWISRLGHLERHYYAHLDRQLVSAGTFVRRGDVIGTVGNTGNARTTAPHLHYGIYAGGEPVDPLPYIAESAPHRTPKPWRETEARGAPSRGPRQTSSGFGNVSPTAVCVERKLDRLKLI
jgi:peptidoglycan LD-endopeptidase LytH